MAKYDAIRDFLASKSGIVDVSMTELSKTIPGGLPKSAYTWKAWWNNDDPTHSQSESWGAAGFVARPDLSRRAGRFVAR